MISKLAKQVIQRGTEKDILVATAESCTGGLIAAALTDIAGSSAVFDRGFVTYSNEAKVQMLGVPVQSIEAQGAVSDLVVRAMAAGALENSRANISVAVTGIAGPGGGTAEKPVGLVYIAVQTRNNPAEGKGVPLFFTQSEICAGRYGEDRAGNDIVVYGLTHLHRLPINRFRPLFKRLGEMRESPVEH